MRFQKAWKIYFWFSLALFVLGLGIHVVKTDDEQTYADFIIDVLGFIIEIIALIGLYAFVSQVALGKRFFWVAFFFLNLGFFLWSMAMSLSLAPTLPEPVTFWVTLFILVFVLLAPQFVAIFLYAFRSPKLWAHRP